MEKNQDTQNHQGNPAGEPCYEVTYLDPDCGRVRSERFDDAAAAERFASRCITDPECWAVVDIVRTAADRAAA